MAGLLFRSGDDLRCGALHALAVHPCSSAISDKYRLEIISLLSVIPFCCRIVTASPRIVRYYRPTVIGAPLTVSRERPGTRISFSAAVLMPLRCAEGAGNTPDLASLRCSASQSCRGAAPRFLCTFIWNGGSAGLWACRRGNVASVNVGMRAEPARPGDCRHTTLDDTDINPRRHIRGAVGPAAET